MCVRGGEISGNCAKTDSTTKDVGIQHLAELFDFHFCSLLSISYFDIFFTRYFCLEDATVVFFARALTLVRNPSISAYLSERAMRRSPELHVLALNVKSREEVEVYSNRPPYEC
jgi:hypothetical protein